MTTLCGPLDLSLGCLAANAWKEQSPVSIVNRSAVLRGLWAVLLKHLKLWQRMNISFRQKFSHLADLLVVSTVDFGKNGRWLFREPTVDTPTDTIRPRTMTSWQCRNYMVKAVCEKVRWANNRESLVVEILMHKNSIETKWGGLAAMALKCQGNFMALENGGHPVNSVKATVYILLDNSQNILSQQITWLKALNTGQAAIGVEGKTIHMNSR